MRSLTLVLLPLLFIACKAETPQTSCDDLDQVLSRRLNECNIRYFVPSTCPGQPPADRSPFCAALAARVDARVLAFDADAARACSDQLAQVSCDDELAGVFLGSDCNSRIYHGTVAAGGSCNTSLDCQSGTCNAGDTNHCPGTCTGLAPMPAGGDCSQAPCQVSLYCNSMSRPATCTAPPGPGQPCIKNPDSYFGRKCAPGAYCNGKSVCQARQQAGALCQDGSQCSASLRCANGTCVPWKPLNESCMGDQECVDGLFCDGGMCHVAAAALGQPCGSLPGHQRRIDCQCGYCTDDPNPQGICTAYTPVGGTCAHSFECVPDSLCVQGKCATQACYQVL